MATETYTESEVVQRQREVKICDYCRLITSDDIEDDQQFEKMLLNPKITSQVYRGLTEYYCDRISRATSDNAEDVLVEIMHSFTINHDNDADLCPNCVTSLFGDGPATGIRRGTGYINGRNY